MTAAARLVRKQAFIEDYIAGNPLDANMDALLAAHGDIVDALEADTPERLALALDEKRTLLSEVGLVEAYERHAAMASSPPDDDVAIRQAPGGLAITALNEALLEGDSRDILVLRNVSGSAPHLRLNLRGDPVFEAQTARLCWMHAPPEPAYGVDLTLHELRMAGATATSRESGVASPVNCSSRILSCSSAGAFSKGMCLPRALCWNSSKKKRYACFPRSCGTMSRKRARVWTLSSRVCARTWRRVRARAWASSPCPGGAMRCVSSMPARTNMRIPCRRIWFRAPGTRFDLHLLAPLARAADQRDS